MIDFKNKVVVITGGGNGIGLSLAKRLINEGAKIMLADVQEEALTKARIFLNAKAETISTLKTDITRTEDWDKLVNKTIQVFGQVDFLFNNAGVYLIKSFDYLTEKDWQWIMDVNFFGGLKGVRAFMPVMEKQKSGGHVVFMASHAALAPMPRTSTYEVSKAATLRLAECCYLEAQEAKKENMRFSVILPSMVKTSLFTCEDNRPGVYSNEQEVKSQEDLKALAARKSDNFGDAFGAIDSEIAIDRIMDQLKKGYFYIYTHRTLTKQVIMEQTRRLLVGYEPPMHLGKFMANYYQTKKER